MWNIFSWRESLYMAAWASCVTVSLAEEGGAAHYAPGAMASIIDNLPVKPGLAVANYLMYYDGSASGVLPFAGLPSLDTSATAYADSLLALYKTPFKVLGGNYGAGLAIPWVWLEVDGELTVTGPRGRTVRVPMHDQEDGLGDILVYPVMVGWVHGDFKYDVRFGIYAPSGDYEKFRLANVGKNYWTFEPAVGGSWLSSKIGTEVSAFAGLDFNTENEDTHYRSGNAFHLDMTLAQHLPLSRVSVIGVGANAFYYQQITGDSGDGARLGDFEGHTSGIGPVISFLTKVAGKDLAAEVKWLPELDVDKRLKGDYVWFKMGMAF